MTTTDIQLMEQALAGDQRAFEALVHRYQNLLYSYARAYVDSEQAHDVTQFVWLQCYFSLPKLLREGPQAGRGREVTLRFWLLRVAHNRCIDEVRKGRRGPLLFSELEQESEDDEPSMVSLLLDSAPQPDEYVEQKEMQQQCRAAIQALPLKFRTILWLRYVEEMSYVEIQRQLRLPLATVKASLFRGRMRLREMLLIHQREPNFSR